MEVIKSDVTSQELQVYNITNPRSVPWSSLLVPIKRCCGQDAKTVSLAEWTKALHALDRTDVEELATKPALKMLDLFDGLAKQKSVLRCEVEKSVRASKTMQTLESVSEELMALWLRQWGYESRT